MVLPLLQGARLSSYEAGPWLQEAIFVSTVWVSAHCLWLVALLQFGDLFRIFVVLHLTASAIRRPVLLARTLYRFPRRVARLGRGRGVG